MAADDFCLFSTEGHAHDKPKTHRESEIAAGHRLHLTAVLHKHPLISSSPDVSLAVF